MRSRRRLPVPVRLWQPDAMSQILYPTFRYQDARAAMEWLESALGFQRGQVHEEGGGIVHAELSFEGAWIMIGAEGERTEGDPFPGGPTTTYIAVDEVDSLHDRAKDAGAEISMGPTDQDYGSREFAARDPEGNVWCFGTYRVGGS